MWEILPRISPTELDLLRKFIRIFGSRRDCYALQRPDGSYFKLDKRWGIREVWSHLEGEQTMAIYPIIKLGDRSLVKFLCFDLDFLEKDGIRNLIYLLRAHGVPPGCMLLEYSVSGDTPVLIRCNGRISLVEIRNAVELLKLGRELEVLGLGAHGVNFYRVYGYHQAHRKVYALRYHDFSFSIRATGDHSVFVLDWDLSISPKRVDQLKPGDLLVSFSKPHLGIRITSQLARSLGIHLSEGYAYIGETNSQTILEPSFHFGDRASIRECIELQSPAFNQYTSLSQLNPFAPEFNFASLKPGSICIDGIQVSWIMEKQSALLDGIHGDGYFGCLHRQFQQARTASIKLEAGLIWLGKLHGMELSGEEAIASHDRSSIQSFHSMDKSSQLKLLPTAPLRYVLNKCFPHDRDLEALKRDFVDLEEFRQILNWILENGKHLDGISNRIIQNALRLVHLGLHAVKLRSLEEAGEERVYDLCVAEAENFFGGVYPILLHNTGGRGYHLWILFNKFYPCEPIYWVARFFCQNFKYSGLKLEHFPKQPRLEQGYSSPIKLPLGIHLKTGKRSVFVHSLERFDPSRYGFDLNQQLKILDSIQMLDPADWMLSPPLEHWLQLKLEQKPEMQIFGTRFPQGIKPSCIQFLERGVPRSLRNLQLSGLSIYYKDQGLDQESTLKELLRINIRNQPPESQSSISSVVRSIYSYDKHWSCSYFRQELSLRSMGRIDPNEVCNPWNCPVKALSSKSK